MFNMASKMASPESPNPSGEDHHGGQVRALSFSVFPSRIAHANLFLRKQIFLGSPSFHQLVQRLAQLTADVKSGKELPFCIQFHWTADKVETLHSKLLRQRDISNLISRFEYDYKSCTVSLKMGQSPGHASLAGTINTILLQRLITSATDAATGMDEKDVKQIFPLFSGKIQQKDKLWYEPDGSFGFFGRNGERYGVKPTMVSEVS